MWTDNYEDFSENQLKTLDKYVTNCSSHIFALKNLPEVIKGTLFARYSRSNLGLRSLLLKDFLNNQEASFENITKPYEEENSREQTEALEHAHSFYERVLIQFGDDSVCELGGAHLAIENISMLAAKFIEDSRIGGSPLEKSTRYIYFDQKHKGEYLFYREPILMTSAYKEEYINTCNLLFDTYSRLIPPLSKIIEEKFPKDSLISKSAYTAALRAKTLDSLRGLLPASTLTNVGIYGNGRFFEQLIHKLHCQNLVELQEIGKKSYQELAKVFPSFIKRAEVSHKTHVNYAKFYETMQSEIKLIATQELQSVYRSFQPGVNLISYDPESPLKVATALLFESTDKGFSEIWEHCKQLSEEELGRILDAGCNARENRRHKSPRALEHAEGFLFEIISDFGTYRDLQRHRLVTQKRQLLTCDYGFYVPPELVNTPYEQEYYQALQQAKEVYDKIAKELPEEAQYVAPMAVNVRWYFLLNLRSLQWLCELRSAPAGHSTYRYIAQEMAKQVCHAIPAFERFFKFVNYEGYELGRIEQEQRLFEKQLLPS